MRNILLACLILNCPFVSAVSYVTVNFRATLQTTTCNISIAVGSNTTVNQTLDFGALTMSQIEAQGSNTRKDFSLQYNDCYITSSGSTVKQTLNWIQTLPKASASWSEYSTELKGGEVGVAAVLYRTSDLNTAIPLDPNNNEKITWSSTERTNAKLPLTLVLRPASSSTTVKTGIFNGTLTFTTTYQ